VQDKELLDETAPELRAKASEATRRSKADIGRPLRVRRSNGSTSTSGG